ncbi:MAG: DUF1176 domain-containing protein [Oricola sp.]
MRFYPAGSPQSRLLKIILALALSGFFVSGAAASQFKRIRDISVNCLDTATCDLSTYNAQSELYTVIFRRSAGVDAPLVLVLGVRETLAAGSEVAMLIDGREILRLPVSQLSYRAAVYEYIFAGEAEIAALVAAAKVGKELRVSYRARGIETASTFSLAGFTGGLTFMDEAQGRVGREDALQGGAGVAADGGEAVREITSFDAIPFQIRAEFANADGGCGMEEARFAALGGFEADLGDGAFMIGLPCGEGGEYNQPYALWERTGSRFRDVVLPVMTPEGPSTTDIAWNIKWDQEKKELTAYSKGSSAGDCGEFERWAWRGGDGSGAFVLLEARAKQDCEGDFEGPDTWPQTWPPG